MVRVNETFWKFLHVHRSQMPQAAAAMKKRARDEDPPLSRNPSAGLGDIMGHRQPLPVSSKTLAKFTPLQRVVLSANGNLQRLVSSFHNSAVTIKSRYNRVVHRGLIEREVELIVFGTIFGVATSTVQLSRADLISAMEEQGLAIGQLFRHLNVMPNFDLRDAGHLDPGALADGEPAVERFYREYELSGDGVKCEIREVLRADLFELTPPATLGPVESGGASMGDIMAPNVTFTPLPDSFAPLERLLLTANGNVARILSSYYARPMQLYVSSNHKRECASVYDRQTALLLDGHQLMLAKTTAFITDPVWLEAVEKNGADVGSLFRYFSELPTFTLCTSGRGPDFFWRQYQLRASGLTCEINETFPLNVLEEDAHSVFSERSCSTEHGGF